jgi:hypothetical protein
MAQGSPSQAARPNSTPVQASKNATVTSVRSERNTTARPALASVKLSPRSVPHWPGEIQACSVPSVTATIPSMPGLKTCFPWTRSTNFEPIAISAASAATQSASVRSNRVSPRLVMIALRRSVRSRP